MKLLGKKYLFIYLFAFVVCIISSCSKRENEDNLTKKWTISQVDFGANLPEESKSIMEPMMDQMKENSYLNFNKDYTFEGFALGMDAKGTWTISDDGSELFLLDKKTKREEKIVIEKLTRDSLVFSAEAQGQPLKFTFIPGK